MMKKIFAARVPKLEIAVFMCGAIVMAFEIVGSRVVAPYLGTSLYVWTSIIGVILGSLSVGYWYGGRLADKRATFSGFSIIIFLSAVSILMCTLFRVIILLFIQLKFGESFFAPILASVILFAPASVALGMVSPYAVKLKLSHLVSSGKTVGNLYALSTLGSIFGTFFAGFYLIPRLGTVAILYVLSTSLLVLSFVVCHKKLRKTRLSFFCYIVAIMSIGLFPDHSSAFDGFVDLDTPYHRVWILDYQYEKKDKKVRGFMTDAKGVQSAMFLDSDDLVFDYTNFYRLAPYFVPHMNNTLLLGGGIYSFPTFFLKEYPEARIDVVEIDPGLTDIAKQYFRLKEHDRLSIINTDARIFLQNNTKEYDVIYKDVFLSEYSIPMHLPTKEAVALEYAALADEGVLMVNLIASIKGKGAPLLHALYKTYNSVFQEVSLYATEGDTPHKTQNIILVAAKKKRDIVVTISDPLLQSFVGNRIVLEPQPNIPILRDDYAPVQHLLFSSL